MRHHIADIIQSAFRNFVKQFDGFIDCFTWTEKHGMFLIVVIRQR